MTFLSVVPAGAPDETLEGARRELARIAADEAPFRVSLLVDRSDDVSAAIAGRAADSDLTILGLQRLGRRRRVFGDLAITVARETDRALLMISRGAS